MRHLSLFLVVGFCNTVFAGQSLQLTNGGIVYQTADPLWSNTSLPWRVEFQVHGIVNPRSNQRLFSLGGTGMCVLVSPTGALLMTDMVDAPINGGGCVLQPSGTNSLVRVQRDLVNARQTCEIWNYDGSGYQSQTQGPIAGLIPGIIYAGGAIGSSLDASIGFIRVLTTVVPMGSKPPTTYTNLSSPDLYTELKFDGNLLDATGNHHDASVYASGTYRCPGADCATTPNQVAASVPRTFGAPNWTNWTSLRAGKPAKLDCSGSFTLIDATATVSSFWQQLSGPTRVRFDNRTLCTPTITGLVFGDYVFQLQVMDSSGNIATSRLETGAVATDDNGVVINADPRVDTLLGPMIAFGRNPWEWVDARHLGVYHRWADLYQVNGGNWRLESADNVQQGTVWVDHGGTQLHGIGTNFKHVFCADGPDGSPGLGYQGIIPLTHFLGPTTAPEQYYRPVTTCNSDTLVTFPDGWYWDPPSIPDSAPVPWGTYRLCSDCGEWTSTAQANSNINFYDAALGHYNLYYRSGWKPAQVSAQWLADRWYRSSAGQSIPRDMSLTSAIIHAVLDPPSTRTYDMWPTIRQTISRCQLPSTPTPLQDVREGAYCLLFTAWQSMFDPDPAAASGARANLVTWWNSTWNQQQPNGNYINNEFEGDSSRSFQMAHGSDVATMVYGSALPSDYCGTVQTSAGTISLSSDRRTITGVGTNFVGTIGMTIGLSGTLNGKPWTMLSTVGGTFNGGYLRGVTAGEPTATQLTLVDPWRGDLGSVSPTMWAIWSGTPHGYHEMFFATTDAVSSWTPLEPDTDNFYFCKVTGSTNIQLSTAYQGDTSTNVYRRPSWQNLAGRGSQPFMQGIVAWALRAASQALDPSDVVKCPSGCDATTADLYKEAYMKIAPWITDYGTNPATKGLYYGDASFSNCRNLAFLEALGCAQSHDTSLGYSTHDAEERSYIPEVMNAYSWRYLGTLNSADLAAGDAAYTAQWAYPNYDSPFPGDGYWANLVDPNISALSKSYGQAFGMGQASSWPAARVGGIPPPENITIHIPFNLLSILNAVKIRVTVTLPSGLTPPPTICDTSPCAVTVDRRAGAPRITIDYLNLLNVVIASGDTMTLYVP